MNPCWIYPQVDLAATSSVDVRVGALPYFFQLWHDTDKVVTYAPSGSGDELQLRLDGCTGAPAATVPLGDSRAARTLSVPLDRQAGVHGVRVTPQVFTTTGELDQFVKALREIAS